MGGMSADVQFEVLSKRGSVRETEKEGERGRDREEGKERGFVRYVKSKLDTDSGSARLAKTVFHLRFLQFVADLADNLRSFVSFLLFFFGKGKVSTVLCG